MSSYEHVTLLLTWRVSSSPAHTDQLLFHRGRQLKFYWLMEFVSVQQNLNFNLTSWFKHGRLGESVRVQLQTVTTCQHEHLQAVINDHRYHAAAAERSPEPSKPRGGLQSDPACRAFSRPLSQRGTSHQNNSLFLQNHRWVKASRFFRSNLTFMWRRRCCHSVRFSVHVFSAVLHHVMSLSQSRMWFSTFNGLVLIHESLTSHRSLWL